MLAHGAAVAAATVLGWRLLAPAEAAVPPTLEVRPPEALVAVPAPIPAPPLELPPVPEVEVRVLPAPSPRPRPEPEEPAPAPLAAAELPPWLSEAALAAREDPWPPPRPRPVPIVAATPRPAPIPSPAPTLPTFIPARLVADARLAPPPVYPAAARRRGLEGVVVLIARVGADGALLALEVSESSGWASLDEEALRAVRAWRRGAFAPATRDGEPMPGEVRLRFRFELTDRATR